MKTGGITIGSRGNGSGFLPVSAERLIDQREPNGEGCIVSDRITREGFRAGCLYREPPMAGRPDSGWRFLAGNENAYLNGLKNRHIFALNTVCNYDRDILPSLHAKIGSAFLRAGSRRPEADDGTQAIFVERQERQAPS